MTRVSWLSSYKICKSFSETRGIRKRKWMQKSYYKPAVVCRNLILALERHFVQRESSRVRLRSGFRMVERGFKISRTYQCSKCKPEAHPRRHVSMQRLRFPRGCSFLTALLLAPQQRLLFPSIEGAGLGRTIRQPGLSRRIREPDFCSGSQRIGVV